MAERLLTDEMIEKTLALDKGDSVKLVSWATESGAKFADNFFNAVKKINVTFLEGDESCTTSYVAKLNPCRGTEDEFNPYRHRAAVKEIFFYQELLPVLNKELSELGQSVLNVPKCFYGHDEINHEVIIFEDLTRRGYITRDGRGSLDKDHVLIMMKEITKLHAASITLKTKLNGKDLVDEYPLLLESWMVEEEPELSNAFATMFTKGALFNQRLLDVLPEYCHLSKWMQNIAPKGMEIILKYLRAEEPWRIICHADFHRGNVMFRYDSFGKPVEVMVIDWQTVRVVPPASEVQYIAFSSVFGKDRSTFLPLALDTYYETLEEMLSSKYKIPYTKYELEEACKTNHFALFLCFFLLPLSFVAEHPDDMFKLDDGLVSSGNDVEKYKKMLEDNPQLKSVLCQYLDDIISRNLCQL